MLRRLIYPKEDAEGKLCIWGAVITVTALSCGISLLITLIVELCLPDPKFTQAFTVATLVPLLVVPPLSYWHSSILYQLRKSKRKIEELSRTDELTGLHNRRYFFELASGLLDLAKRHETDLAVAIIDLDRFKLVNDRFGHQAGDAVLKKAAGIINALIRASDVLARYGGEEFILLMPQTSGAGALKLAERIRLKLAAETAGGHGDPHQVTISICAASSDQLGYDMGTLLLKADKALYQAKDEGRNRCFLAQAQGEGHA